MLKLSDMLSSLGVLVNDGALTMSGFLYISGSLTSAGVLEMIGALSILRFIFIQTVHLGQAGLFFTLHGPLSVPGLPVVVGTLFLLWAAPCHRPTHYLWYPSDGWSA